MNILKSINVFVLLCLITACSGDSTKPKPDPISAFLPEGAQEIEIVGDTLFYTHHYKLYKSSLDGQTQLIDDKYSSSFEELDSAIWGLGEILISDLRAYKSDNSIVEHPLSVSNLNAFSDGNRIFAVNENQIVVIDESLQFNNIDVSSALSLLGDDITIDAAFIDNESPLITYRSNGDEEYNTALIHDGQVIDISKGPILKNNFRTVEKINNEQILAILFHSKIELFDYETELTTTLELGSKVGAMFKIGDELYYTVGSFAIYRLDTRTLSFEKVDIPGKVGFIYDVEHYQNEVYAGTSQGVWKIDIANDVFEQIIGF